MPPLPRSLFVINPTSGGTDKTAYETAIAAHFAQQPDQYEWYEMTGDGDAGSLQYWVEHFGPERVIAVGGDGTLKFVAENLLRTGIVTGFLPAGSANGMARELNIPADIEAALELATSGKARSMDVVKINGHVSLHLSDVGLNAQLVKHFEESGRRGMWGYASEVWRVLRNKQIMDLTIEADGKKLQRSAWMAVIANARLYGTGATINPDGDLYDGRFELVLLKKLWLWQMVKMLLRNRRFDKRKTEIIPVKKLRICCTGPIHFQVDGEYLGEVTEVEAEILAGAVEMVVGAPA